MAIMDENVLSILEKNLKPKSSLSTDLESIFNGKGFVQRKLTRNEKAFIEQYPHAYKPDILSVVHLVKVTQMPTIA